MRKPDRLQDKNMVNRYNTTIVPVQLDDSALTSAGQTQSSDNGQFFPLTTG